MSWEHSVCGSSSQEGFWTIRVTTEEKKLLIHFLIPILEPLKWGQFFLLPSINTDAIAWNRNAIRNQYISVQCPAFADVFFFPLVPAFVVRMRLACSSPEAKQRRGRLSHRIQGLSGKRAVWSETRLAGTPHAAAADTGPVQLHLLKRKLLDPPLHM